MKKLILPIIIFLLGSAGLFYSLYYLSPYKNGGGLNFINLAQLLTSLFLALAAFSALLVYFGSFILYKLLSQRFKTKRLTGPSLKPRIKQGVMVGVFALIFSFLQITKTNSILNLILLVLIFVLIESYFWRR